MTDQSRVVPATTVDARDGPGTGSATMIRVFVVEDHPVMRRTLRSYLARTGDIEVCGEAQDAESALSAIPGTASTVVLLDVALPGRSGLELLPEVKRRWGLPCVVLSGHGESGYVERALEAGADAYVLKGTPAEIPVAIRSAVEGGRHVSASLDDAAGSDGT